jgi:hypothetical protein
MILISKLNPLSISKKSFINKSVILVLACTANKKPISTLFSHRFSPKQTKYVKIVKSKQSPATKPARSAQRLFAKKGL